MSERSIHPIIPTAMALALGATSTLLLQSQEARGYPAGASVSLGSNPVVSKGWSFSPGESSTLLSASADSLPGHGDLARDESPAIRAR